MSFGNSERISGGGLEHPIVLWAPDKETEPMVIDGRNRLDAMELVGMETFYETKSAAITSKQVIMSL